MGRLRSLGQAKSESDSRGLITIGIEQASIQLGRHYTTYYEETGASAATDYYSMLSIPSGLTYDVNMTYEVMAGLPVAFSMYEDATVTASGVELPIYNNNRSSTRTSEISVWDGPTVGSEGTRIDASLVGTTGVSPAGSTGNIMGREHEFKLKSNSNYLVKVTPYNNSTDFILKYNWYETPR